MTQQLRQAISLLQVSNLELESIIAKELESNPLLERENDRLADSDAGGQTIDDYDTPPPAAPDTEEFKPDIDCDNQFDDYASDREGYDEFPQQDWQDYAASKINRDSGDYDYFEQKLAAEKSLFQLLEEPNQRNFRLLRRQDYRPPFVRTTGRRRLLSRKRRCGCRTVENNVPAGSGNIKKAQKL